MRRHAKKYHIMCVNTESCECKRVKVQNVTYTVCVQLHMHVNRHDLSSTNINIMSKI